MKTIQLTQGKSTIVDDEDYANLSRFNWQYFKGFAKRGLSKKYGCRMLIMAREILACPPGSIVDHINGDQLDNRRCNLRITDWAGNARNARKTTKRKTSSRFKGVTWSKKEDRWQASLQADGRKYWLGYFDSELEAAQVYDKAALDMFREFACPNFSRPAKAEGQP